MFYFKIDSKKAIKKFKNFIKKLNEEDILPTQNDNNSESGDNKNLN
tara:strand:+ start:749 stop:886 length:138 start_codon:yes stop_codon:yes gene_type:complete